MIIICFIISVGITGLATTDIKYTMYADNTDPLPLRPDGKTEILLFASGYGHLMGILGGGFYLHNISLPIYRASKNPKNNVRDMFLGFFVVFMSYVICGCLGAIGFSSRKTFGDTPIADNFLNMYDTKSIPAVIIRICCFF